MTVEEWREMQEAIAVLQRDVKENKQEISYLGYRVFELEKAKEPPPRFQTGYGQMAEHKDGA